MSAIRSSSTLLPRTSTSTGAPSLRQSQLDFVTTLASYRVIPKHVSLHLNLAPSINRGIHTGAQSSVLPQGPPPLPPLPSGPPSGHWKQWVVGALVAVFLSFVKGKWGPLLRLKDEVERVVETADIVAEVVEKVAEQVERAADAVADNTPENSKLHAAATLVEIVAKEVAKDAHLADAALDKVVEVEKEVEKDVESLVEPIINVASRITKEPNA